MISNKIPEHEISAAAEKTLCKSADYNKRAFYQPGQAQQTTATCGSCNQPYNKTFTEKVISKLKPIKAFTYQNICLTCIREASRASKTPKYHDLKASRSALDEIQLIYCKAHNKYKADKAAYQELDYQENIINHEINQQAARKTRSTTKTGSKKPSAKSAADAAALAMKALENLSPEVRQAILANMSKN